MKTLFERLLDAGVLTQDELERYKNLNELVKNRDVDLDRFSMEFSNDITARIDAFLELNPIGSELLAGNDEEYTSYCFDKLPKLLEGFEKVEAGFDLILQSLLASQQRVEQLNVELAISQEVEQVQVNNVMSGNASLETAVIPGDCVELVFKKAFQNEQVEVVASQEGEQGQAEVVVSHDEFLDLCQFHSQVSSVLSRLLKESENTGTWVAFHAASYVRSFVNRLSDLISIQYEFLRA